MKIINDLFWYSKNKPLSHLFFRGYSANIYALKQSNDEIWLFDVGVKQLGRPKRIIKWMEQDGLDPKNISKIFITHAHPDHINGINHFKNISKSDILIHELDKEMMIGRYPYFFNLIAQSGNAYNLKKELFSAPKILMKMIALYSMGKMPKISPDKTFIDGDRFSGEKYTIEVIYAPGHTKGHSCFFIKELNALISGDLFDTSLDNKPSLNFAYTDYDDYAKSLQRVSELKIDYLLTMHGDIIHDNTVKKNNIPYKINSAIFHLKEEEEKILKFLEEKGTNGASFKDFKQLYHVGSYYDIGDYKGFAFSTLKSLVKRNLIKFQNRRFIIN